MPQAVPPAGIEPAAVRLEAVPDPAMCSSPGFLGLRGLHASDSPTITWSLNLPLGRPSDPRSILPGELDPGHCSAPPGGQDEPIDIGSSLSRVDLVVPAKRGADELRPRPREVPVIHPTDMA